MHCVVLFSESTLSVGATITMFIVMQIPEDSKEQTAEADTKGGAEDKLESSERTQGIVEKITDGVTKGVKELSVEEKPRVIPKPGDGQKIYKIDPMLEDFRSHLDYR